MELKTDKLFVSFKVEVTEQFDDVITVACNDIARESNDIVYTAYINTDKLIDMLKRNQPKEVIAKTNYLESLSYDPYILKTWHTLNCRCPNCNTRLYTEEVTYTVRTKDNTYDPRVNGKKFRYCPDCGQALDWSNTEFNYDIEEGADKLKVTPKNKEKGNELE